MNNTALYIRLSKEDENKENKNSESVINQKKLLLKYVQDNNYNLYDVYIDDGYSGTNFDRPDFKRLIKDIESKKINTVIVKDLSRFGRDYIKTGEYIEKWFPEHNVRFISILDNIDTFLDNSNNDFLPFKAIINDFYSKENSKKIKAALKIKQLNGKWVGGCTPFGYMKDPFDKNHLVLNEKEAVIVRRIFKMALSSYSINQIIEYLYKNKILTPNAIRKNYNSYCWSRSTIKTILKNYLYTGNLIQNRRSRINYKIKKLKNNKEIDWIIVPNTHEKIIDEKEFNEINRLLKLNGNIKSNKKNKTILDGVLYCGECKKKMIIQKNKNIKYIMCNTYKKYSKLKICSVHSNNYMKIESEIVDLIKYYLNRIDKSKLSILGNAFNKKINDIENKIEKSKVILDRVYLDKLENIIDEDTFERMYSKIKNDIYSLESNKKEKVINYDNIFDRLKANISDKIINKIIQKIEIHDDKSIDIYWNFKMI